MRPLLAGSRLPALLLALAALPSAGCANGRFRSRVVDPTGEEGTAPGRTDPGADEPEAFSIEVDTSGSDTYLPLEATTGEVRGTVTASAGADRAEVDGEELALDARDGFRTSVPLSRGLTHVEVHGFDGEGRSARGDRALLRAEYLDEGALREEAVALAVDDALLGAMASAAVGSLGMLELSSFVAPGTAVVSGSPCTIYVDSITHAPPTVALSTTADGRLRGTVRLTDVTVNVHGRCSALGLDVELRPGTQIDETDVELTTALAPSFPAAGECADGLVASDTSVRITRFDIDLRLGGCGLLCSAAGEAVGELAEGYARDYLEEKVEEMVIDELGPALDGLSILETATSLDFLGTPVDVGLCMTGLESAGGVLVATLGVSARGPGGATDAPGAPGLPASVPALPSGSLALDPALVGQILFSAWRAGALRIDSLGPSGSMGGVSLNVDLLAGVVPALRPLLGTEIPRGSALELGIDATMAPLVRVATPTEAAMGADLFLELGDLRLRIGVAGRDLFVLSSTVRLALALEADASGALVPTLVREATTTSTSLASTTVPSVTSRMGEGLASLVDGLVPTQIAPLLEGAAITLPDLGVPLSIADIAPDAGGFLVIELATR
jgi:hypothetical protein